MSTNIQQEVLSIEMVETLLVCPLFQVITVICYCSFYKLKQNIGCKGSFKCRPIKKTLYIVTEYRFSKQKKGNITETCFTAVIHTIRNYKTTLPQNAVLF